MTGENITQNTDIRKGISPANLNDLIKTLQSAHAILLHDFEYNIGNETLDDLYDMLDDTLTALGVE